jgi:hypothetical protein
MAPAAMTAPPAQKAILLRISFSPSRFIVVARHYPANRPPMARLSLHQRSSMKPLDPQPALI